MLLGWVLFIDFLGKKNAKLIHKEPGYLVLHAFPMALLQHDGSPKAEGKTFIWNPGILSERGDSIRRYGV